MNLPNQLTILRFLLAGLFVALGSLPQVIPFAWTSSLVVFGLASLTDWLDGYIARTRGLVTDFGKLMDPLADKVLVLAALLLLVAEGIFTAWAAAIILSREFLVTGLRLVAASKGHVLAAENLGKYKTVLQTLAIVCGLVWMAAREWNSETFSQKIFLSVTYIIYYSATALTALSGALYFWKNRQLLGNG